MVHIGNDWDALLADYFASEQYQSLRAFLAQEYRTHTVYPNMYDIFNALKATPYEKVRVVILGQDPYHGPGQAMGLSFSVPRNVQAPPSLKNIFREIESDLGIRMSGSPDLTPWARQGVLLLNTSLTVEAASPMSHSRIGWAEFTDAVIRYLSDSREGIVFLLWGRFAQGKKALVDTSRHSVLEAAHPSPLAGGAFFGCRHFSKTNEILINEGKSPINWQL